jgi:type VI secretion system protein ImpK
MQDNPFAEPDDTDLTVIRPAPGGRRAAPPPPTQPAATRIVAAGAEEPTQVAAAPVRPRVATLSPASSPVSEVTTAGADPLIAAATPLLQLLARLRNTLTQPDAGDLRERTAREIRAFEQRTTAAGIAPHVLRLAHYALCASLDDVVLNTPWGSEGGWNRRSLVSTFHQEVRGGERFFDILDLARKTPARFRPVLELMYLCLSLGFMGRYRLSPRGASEIEQVREEVYALLAGSGPRTPVELSPAWQGVAAPYRAAHTRLPVWVAGAAALAVLGGAYGWVATTLNAASDTAYEAALTLPPASAPAIARSYPVAPPAQPVMAEQSALERLRAFLKPEIEAGLVQVLGTEQAPVVRVRGTGLFASGSAAIDPHAVPVLQRVGQALRTEPGQVQVLGYTDNEPIRTLRFPSNFQLSAARAEAARAVLAQSIGDAARLSAEGRADADPVAPNTTPDGREANRRIEIILHRQD